MTSDPHAEPADAGNLGEALAFLDTMGALADQLLQSAAAFSAIAAAFHDTVTTLQARGQAVRHGAN